MHRRLLLAALWAAPSLALASAGAPGEPQLYQRFPTLTVSVPMRGGLRGVMTVEAGVESPDPALAERVKALQPRLRSAWFEALQRLSVSRPGAPPDADLIARTLQAETDRVLGRKGAAFLLGSIIVR